MHSPHPKQRLRYARRTWVQGFTLIELSVVLVIIGLIVGGVLVGRDLIRAAEVRAQISQLEEYAAALGTFKGKFDCLPGDCLKASDFSLGTNGNGNETLEAVTPNLSSYITADGIFDGEIANFFVHLSAAKLIKGNFNGATQIGVGYPRLAINNAFGMVVASGWQVGGTGTEPNSLGDLGFPVGFWLFGDMCTGALATAGAMPPVIANDGCGVMTPSQANSIDKKIDDGKPISGRFWGYSPAGMATNCTLSPYTAYNLTANTPVCQFANRVY